MAKSVSISIDDKYEGKRLDIALNEAELYASRSRSARAIEDGRVFVNGSSAAKRYIAKAGDFVVCELDEDESPIKVHGEPIPLDIRYEDDSMMVISKPAGMLTHPSPEHSNATLVNALIYRYGREGLCNVQGDDDRPGIVHRLDGDTSGLMLAAKTDEAGSILMDDIALRNVDRHYITLVHGVINSDTGMIDAPIARNPKNRLQMGVYDTASSREAMTTFKCLARYSPTNKDNGYTLLECKLYTGRTHQIRVHMQYISHPVVGDQTYTSHAPKNPDASLGLTRQFLHSYMLGFTHPINGEEMQFRDTLPEDLSNVLCQLKDRCEFINPEFDLNSIMYRRY